MKTNSAKTGYAVYTRNGGADRDWQRLAACRGVEDPEIFFPTRGSGPPSREYRRALNGIRALFCDDCPVQGECLDYAIKLDNRFGIWAGKGEDERPHGGRA